MSVSGRAMIWALAAFACASHAAEGQTVNLRAGGSFTKLVQDRASYTNTTDFTAGISLDIPAPGLPLRIGATWVRKHESAEHIEVPALVLFGWRAHAFAGVGLSFGIRTGGIAPCGTGEPCPPPELSRPRTPVGRFDLSGAVTAGFRFPLSDTLSYGLEVVYLHGLVEYDSLDGKPRTFLATMGIGIPLG